MNRITEVTGDLVRMDVEVDGETRQFNARKEYLIVEGDAALFKGYGVEIDLKLAEEDRATVAAFRETRK